MKPKRKYRIMTGVYAGVLGQSFWVETSFFGLLWRQVGWLYPTAQAAEDYVKDRRSAETARPTIVKKL